MATKVEKGSEEVTEIDRLKELFATTETAERNIILENRLPFSVNDWGIIKRNLECAMKTCFRNSFMDQRKSIIEDLEMVSTTKGICVLTVNECAKGKLDVFELISTIGKSFLIYPVVPSKVPLVGILLGIPRCALSGKSESIIAFIHEKCPCLKDISVNYQPFSGENAGHHRIHASVLDLRKNNVQLGKMSFVWNSFEATITFTFDPKVPTRLELVESYRLVLGSQSWL